MFKNDASFLCGKLFFKFSHGIQLAPILLGILPRSSKNPHPEQV